MNELQKIDSLLSRLDQLNKLKFNFIAILPNLLKELGLI